MLEKRRQDEDPKVGIRLHNLFLLMSPPAHRHEFTLVEWILSEVLGILDLKGNGLGISCIRDQEVYTGILRWNPYIPLWITFLYVRPNEIFACVDCK